MDERDRIEVASEKGATKWVQAFLRRYLRLLLSGEITGEAFVEELESEFASRRLTTIKQQKNYRSNIVQALKMVDAEPSAIALVAPTTEDYRRLNDEQRGRVAERSTQYLEPAAVESLVERAAGLLESAEWSEVGAGLAVLMGRRISEILLSKFSLKSAWSLNFSQMVKKGDAVDITIEIPTLARAEKVLSTLEKLQQRLTVADLRRNNASSSALKQAVNHRYSLAVAQQCEAHFSGLVPYRSDKENLYTHIFRAVYATIAAHWFCPPQVPEHQYKAEIQGHFTLTETGEKLPNYAARSNYDDYAIGDGKGNRDGRLGIKLGHLPGLEVIEAFRGSREIEIQPPVDESEGVEKKDMELGEMPPIPEEEEPMSKEPERPTKRPQVYADDLARMIELMVQVGVSGSPAEQFCALLDAYEALKSGEQQQQQTETVSEVVKTIHWFTEEIDRLRAQNLAVEQECDRLLSQKVDTEKDTALETENAQLKRELAEVKQQLEAIYKVLGQPVPQEPMGVARATTPSPSAPVPVPVSPVSGYTVAAQAEEPAQPVSRQRDRTDSKSKVEAIIQDIINWNTAQQSNDTRLRISISVIKALGSLVGATYQPVIMEVLKEQESVIEEIHRRFMLGARHNVSVDKDRILQEIARDYMGVENWQAVRY